MAKVTAELEKLIRADKSVGLTYRKLQEKYSLSLAVLNRICKGVDESNAKIVQDKTNAEIAYLTALSEKSGSPAFKL